ncbi:MAG: hypothetical protein HY727_18600 [Candidatus Rokubacteria bacterium]|nr:hypothetical protein [Candidatus Rokubacteria bacterium]
MTEAPRAAFGLALVLVAAWVSGAAAEEAKSSVSASMLLGILSSPVESREAAFDQSLKERGPEPARRWADGELLPDGSVRYGRVTVTVKNPCPPGTAHYEPPSLPGRRTGN